MNNGKAIRLVMPQWQGGADPAYGFGAEMLAWLAPETGMPIFHVPVKEPGERLVKENGMPGRGDINDNLDNAWAIIKKERPDRIVTLGGDCLVSLAPFAWLSQNYGEGFGVLWIDTHPDVQTLEQYENPHAHVLGALLGNGDPDLTRTVDQPLNPANVLIAGIHDPLPVEAAFIAEWGIETRSPQVVKDGTHGIAEWIAERGIKHLAVHFDLDVLDPHQFRSVLFARPGRGEHDFGDVAEGQINIQDVVELVSAVAGATDVVGLTISEHLPWDAINLREMLTRLPLIGA